jgi:hypothetical protein
MNLRRRRPASGIVQVAAWLYVARRAAVAAVILAIVGLAGFMVFMAWIQALGR